MSSQPGNVKSAIERQRDRRPAPPDSDTGVALPSDTARNVVPGPRFASTRSSQPDGGRVRAAALEVLLRLEVAAADARRRDAGDERELAGRPQPVVQRLQRRREPPAAGAGQRDEVGVARDEVGPHGLQVVAAQLGRVRREDAQPVRRAAQEDDDERAVRGRGRRGVRGPGGHQLGAERGHADHAEAAEEPPPGPAAVRPRRVLRGQFRGDPLRLGADRGVEARHPGLPIATHGAARRESPRRVVRPTTAAPSPTSGWTPARPGRSAAPCGADPTRPCR